MKTKFHMAMRVLALTLALGGLVGCSEQQLTGSLGTVYPLRFESLRARLYPTSLSIEFVQLDGAVPVRVTVDRSATAAPGAIDLLASGDVTGRTSEGREIPRFSEGDIRFDPLDFMAGQTVSGDFRATFIVTETDTLALAGRFSAPLEVVVEPGPPPPVPDDP